MKTTIFTFPRLDSTTDLFSYCKKVEGRIEEQLTGALVAWRYVNAQLSAYVMHQPADTDLLTRILSWNFKAATI